MAKKTLKPVKAKAPARRAVSKTKAVPSKAKPKLTAKAKPIASAAEVKSTTAKKAEGKKLSPKLLEAIEKRQSAKAADSKGKPTNPFGRPMGRRGRRPKRLAEYTPTNGEEGSNEQVENENQYEGLEYDTGIRVKEHQSDEMFSMDRFEDFDEELNFDR